MLETGLNLSPAEKLLLILKAIVSNNLPEFGDLLLGRNQGV